MSIGNVGLALTTPSLLDDGLTGTQGWSPCTSYCEDGEDDRSDVGLEQHDSHAHGVHVTDWPMPPHRPTSSTKPLAVRKRVVSEVRPAQGLDALGIFVERQEHLRDQQADRAGHRRILSEPLAPQNAQYDEDGEEEIDEYPFPLMKTTHRSEPAMSEEEKLNRLRASFSLLELDRPDPHYGGYYSPEHGAPSLAEQMAYASGLGSQCDWSSPSRTEHASSDGYYLKHQPSFSQESRKMANRHAVMARRPTHDSVEDIILQPGKGAEVHRSWTVYNRNRHAEEQKAPEEEEQDTDRPYRRCGTPSRSRAASTVVSSSSSPILAGLFAAGSLAVAREPLASSYASSSSSSSAASSASSRSSHDTCATSVEIHQQRQQQAGKNIISKLSPIEVERLFQGQLDLLTPPSVSYSPDLPERLRNDFGSQANSPVTGQAIMPTSLTTTTASATTSPDHLSFHDFGHLFQGDFEGQEEEGHEEDNHGKAQRKTVPQTDFSPAIATPQIFTPAPMEHLPSPMADDWTKRPLRHISGQFLAPPVLEDGASHPQQQLAESMRKSSMPENPRFTMPKSASTASVLSRPRPCAASTSSNALFGRDEEVHVVSVKKRRAPKVQMGPIPPTRKTSLELVGRSESRLSHNSMEAFYNESAKVLLGGGEDPALDRSCSKPLSPTGAAQVREASRMKAGHLVRRCPVPILSVPEAAEMPTKSASTTLLPLHKERRSSVQFAPSPIKSKFPTFDDLPSNVVIEKKKTLVLPFKRPKTAMTTAQVTTPATYSRSESEPCFAPLPASMSTSSTKPKATAPASLPTLFLARSASQRRKGLTGFEPTEPRNLALARLGFAATGPTRSSTVQALFDASRPSKAQRYIDENNNEDRHEARNNESDAGFSMMPPFPTPEGFVLVVEETVTTCEHVVVPLAK